MLTAATVSASFLNCLVFFALIRARLEFITTSSHDVLLGWHVVETEFDVGDLAMKLHN